MPKRLRQERWIRIPSSMSWFLLTLYWDPFGLVFQGGSNRMCENPRVPLDLIEGILFSNATFMGPRNVSQLYHVTKGIFCPRETSGQPLLYCYLFAKARVTLSICPAFKWASSEMWVKCTMREIFCLHREGIFSRWSSGFKEIRTRQKIARADETSHAV